MNKQTLVIHQSDESAPVAGGKRQPADNALAAVGAAAIGNVLEWYDFSVYAFVAPILARQYFPKVDELSALLGTFAIFGVGFLMRPLGGFCFGRIADHHGRKSALTLTIMLMAVSTIAIGIIPSYEAIGAFASLAMLFARLLQGFSAGGEWGSANTFLVEWAPNGKRGLIASFAQVTTVTGTLLGSAVAASLSSALSSAAFESWGWRMLFLFGGLIGPIGFYLRRNVAEHLPAELKQPADPHAPGHALRKIAQAIGFTVVWVTSHYILLHYMPTYLTRYAHLSRTEALWSDSIGLVVMILLIPLTGALSDRIGRRPLLLGCCALLVVLPYPLARLLLSGVSFGTVIGVQILFGIVLAMYSGPAPAAIAEIFPARERAVGMSVGYSVGVAVFGGFSPFAATLLIQHTGSPISPVFCVIAAALLSGLTLWHLPETAHTALK
ncbi:MFS transporter [Paraburkholderia sp. Ac-20342]|uniref:MFS transporter n=1 Tax=Paraburkholderia sp. Ac-20342 TaxID=2703889 RepID=UPI0019824349|nr:MFS transporter [Paraburkholderia sp. Ac-20342]MBN3851437.1 MFS transporter [Paraburkholderia sp. Ac-20342]